MKGFGTEAQLWKYMKPRLQGTWYRCEFIFPAGHPDVMGSSYLSGFSYVELKIAETPSRSMMEPSQLEFIPWLIECCHQKVYVCVGSPYAKMVLFFYGLDFSKPVTPLFWRG